MARCVIPARRLGGFRSPLLLVAVVFVGFSLACNTATSPVIEVTSVEVIKTWIEPFVNVKGAKMPMVMISWRNTGSRPIRVVDADISLFDANGRLLGTLDDTIFAVTEFGHAISPGEVHTDPKGDGVMLIDYAEVFGRVPPMSARVKITGVRESLKMDPNDP